jgi:hypothetical protein
VNPHKAGKTWKLLLNLEKPAETWKTPENLGICLRKYLAESHEAFDRMSLSTLKNDLLIQKQACRLLSVANVVYTDPLVRLLRDRLKPVTEERDRLQEERDKLRTQLAFAVRESLGIAVLRRQIMLYSCDYFGLQCNCQFCCRAFDLSETRIKQRRMCEVFGNAIEVLRESGLRYAFIKYRTGRLVEFHPEVPADFPPLNTAFPADTLSHIQAHIVFDQIGNPYDFKYGRRLWHVDSLEHPEAVKLYAAIKELQRRSLSGY